MYKRIKLQGNLGIVLQWIRMKYYSDVYQMNKCPLQTVRDRSDISGMSHPDPVLRRCPVYISFWTYLSIKIDVFYINFKFTEGIRFTTIITTCERLKCTYDVYFLINVRSLYTCDILQYPNSTQYLSGVQQLV